MRRRTRLSVSHPTGYWKSAVLLHRVNLEPLHRNNKGTPQRRGCGNRHMRAAHRSTQSLHAWTHVRRRARSNPARTWYRALATSGLCRYCGSLLFGMDCTGRLFRACDPVQSFTASKTPSLCFRRPNHHDTPSQYSRLQHGWLLFGALPEHAGIALERHKPLAGIGPVLLLLEGDVIDRLAASAALKERARNVDHVP